MKIAVWVWIAMMVVASSSFAQDAPQNLGAAGESCRARSDCKGGLRCVNQVCTDEHEGQTCAATSDCGELRCIQNKCTTPAAAAHASTATASSSGDASMDAWMKFNPFDGNLHPYAGITGAGGFGTAGVTGNTLFTGGFNTFDGTAMFALEGGLYSGQHQASFEVAPVTYVWDAKAAPGPVFEMTANYAYFIPLADHIYWPVRFGIGMMAGPNSNALGLAFFEVRADLIGAAFQFGHVVVDLHLPSFRYMITDKSGIQAHFLHWLFGVTVGYAF
jgi:hypothetical protein